ncbi:unnamed protein product [Amoebophrya sp. A120]|nr:unnamed protein product [Amoebophrya sp. A120]|eukprot:GSA120T00016441001.1
MKQDDESSSDSYMFTPEEEKKKPPPIAAKNQHNANSGTIKNRPDEQGPRRAGAAPLDAPGSTTTGRKNAARPPVVGEDQDVIGRRHGTRKRSRSLSSQDSSSSRRLKQAATNFGTTDRSKPSKKERNIEAGASSRRSRSRQEGQDGKLARIRGDKTAASSSSGPELEFVDDLPPTTSTSGGDHTNVDLNLQHEKWLDKHRYYLYRRPTDVTLRRLKEVEQRTSGTSIIAQGRCDAGAGPPVSKINAASSSSSAASSTSRQRGTINLNNLSGGNKNAGNNRAGLLHTSRLTVHLSDPKYQFSRKLPHWDHKYEKLPRKSDEKTIQPIGQGAYGKVYKAKNKQTGQIVAAKVTTKMSDEEGGVHLAFLREVHTLRLLEKCDSIVKLIELAVTSKGDPVIVLEYCHASLTQLLQSEKHPLTMANIKYLMQQVLQGVDYMHQIGMLHRDLATKNILFNISGEIKVCDFGLSRVAFGEEEDQNGTKKLVLASNLEPPQFIVTILYRSIELLLGEQKYGPALDIWGVGCILAEILIFKGGVSKKPFFYDQTLGNNVTEQTVSAYILTLLGKPTRTSWPDYEKLLRQINFENFEAQVRKARPHQDRFVLNERTKMLMQQRSGQQENNKSANRNSAFDRNSRTTQGTSSSVVAGVASNPNSFFNNEALELKALFTTGSCKQVRNQLYIKDSLFQFLGGLLNLDPKFRLTSQEALQHFYFTETPVPQWDAGRFATTVDVVTGALETSKEEKERRLLVKMLEESEKKNIAAGGSGRAPTTSSRGGSGATGAGNINSNAKIMSRSGAPAGGSAAVNTTAGTSSSGRSGALAAASSSAAHPHPAAPGTTTLSAGVDQDQWLSRAGKRLPPNWQKRVSKTNQKIYYANLKTLATQWHTPTTG